MINVFSRKETNEWSWSVDSKEKCTFNNQNGVAFFIAKQFFKDYSTYETILVVKDNESIAELDYMDCLSGKILEYINKSNIVIIADYYIKIYI